LTTTGIQYSYHSHPEQCKVDLEDKSAVQLSQ
jgi:hypothetical protein